MLTAWIPALASAHLGLPSNCSPLTCARCESRTDHRIQGLALPVNISSRIITSCHARTDISTHHGSPRALAVASQFLFSTPACGRLFSPPPPSANPRLDLQAGPGSLHSYRTGQHIVDRRRAWQTGPPRRTHGSSPSARDSALGAWSTQDRYRNGLDQGFEQSMRQRWLVGCCMRFSSHLVICTFSRVVSVLS